VTTKEKLILALEEAILTPERDEGRYEELIATAEELAKSLSEDDVEECKRIARANIFEPHMNKVIH
tara:strand:- start:128 stop:325 length:198 start_codon:yes stop_codon:yes gene_type:complete